MEKMNVLSAIQIFSPADTATIQFLKDNQCRINTKTNYSESDSTIKFMTSMYKFFTFHDISDRTQYLRQNNPDCVQFFSAADERLNWLSDEFCTNINKVQIESKRAKLKGLTNETAEALLFTVKSTVQCVTYLLENGFFYVLTRRFSGDPIEALFSSVRLGGGCNDMTDARTAASAIKRILKSGLLISSKHANIANSSWNNFNETLSVKCSRSQEDRSNEDILLPNHVTLRLENIRVPSFNAHISLETASQALVCGYLVRVVEERLNSDLCQRQMAIFRNPHHHLHLCGLSVMKTEEASDILNPSL